MKHAVSVSIGSAKRDKRVNISLLGKDILLERIGTDGDLKRARQLYEELDSRVDALGVGGAVLGLQVAERWYPFYSVIPLVQGVKHTPVVDGTGLKMTLEATVGSVLKQYLDNQNKEKKALIMTAVDRWGLAQTFLKNGYTCVFGDFFFSLGLPIPIRTESAIKKLARLLLPIMSRLPFTWLYPVGEAQERRTPKMRNYFHWADIIAGDSHYITHYMPEELPGKIIVTNTTTRDDVALFQHAGVKTLITTTPVFDGRSFGTNMLEAGILAALEYDKPVNYAQPGDYYELMNTVIKEIKLTPQIQEL